MACSYHRKVLRVDLTSGTVRVEEPSDAFYRRNMGGWNLIAEVLLREVPVGADPLGPANKLVFAPGVLTGLALSGASRNAIGAKSPLTGAFGAAEVGGGWAAQLKQAGYDAVIFEGASPSRSTCGCTTGRPNCATRPTCGGRILRLLRILSAPNWATGTSNAPSSAPAGRTSSPIPAS